MKSVPQRRSVMSTRRTSWKGPCDRFPVYYPDHLARISDPVFMKFVRAYWGAMEWGCEELSAVRLLGRWPRGRRKTAHGVSVRYMEGFPRPNSHAGFPTLAMSMARTSICR